MSFTLKTTTDELDEVVEEILGKPTKIINTTKENKNYQMWIYELENINKTFDFEDYILFKIEN